MIGERHPDAGEGRPQQVSPCCAWILRLLDELDAKLQRMGYRRSLFTPERSGTVPPTGGVGNTYFLAADGTWLEPAGGGGGGSWGSITGTLSDQADLQDELDAKADAGLFTASGLTATGTGILVGLQTGTDAPLEVVTLGPNMTMIGNVLDAVTLSGTWGDITGDLTDQADVVAALADKADVSDVTRYRRIDFHATVGTNGALTNMAASERFAFGNSNAPVHVADLTGCTQVRYSARVITAGVAGSKLRLRYKLATFSTTFGDYLQLGNSGHVEIPIDSATLVHSGWVDIDPAAANDTVFLAPTELDGNGVADPTVRWLCAEFR